MFRADRLNMPHHILDCAAVFRDIVPAFLDPDAPFGQFSLGGGIDPGAVKFGVSQYHPYTAAHTFLTKQNAFLWTDVSGGQSSVVSFHNIHNFKDGRFQGSLLFQNGNALSVKKSPGIFPERREFCASRVGIQTILAPRFSAFSTA